MMKMINFEVVRIVWREHDRLVTCLLRKYDKAILASSIKKAQPKLRFFVNSNNGLPVNLGAEFKNVWIIVNPWR